MVAQRRRGGGGEEQLAVAARLGGGDHLFVVGRGALLGDGERAGLEVDVAPSQTGQLTASHSRVQRQRPHADEPVVGECVEESFGVLGRPDLQRLGRSFRDPHRRRRVEHDHVPAHRVGERPMQHPVGELDRVRRERLAVLPTGLEQRAVPLLDGKRCEFTQACRSEIRVDVAPHRLARNSPTRSARLRS